jgi:hypothetical protein
MLSPAMSPVVMSVAINLAVFARCQKRGRQALITLSLAVNVNYCIYYSALKATVTYYGVNCEITSQNNDNDDQIK